MLKRFTLSVGLLTLTMVAFAQNEDRGNFSAGLETNTTYYLEDKGTGATPPAGRLGTNNYLKLDYTWKGFYAGAQLEGYLPAVQGYFTGFEGNFFRADVYAGYNANGWDIRLGSIYDQFGSGMLFRTYEDRTLGINNAIRGVKVGYTFGDFLTVKALYGQTRDVKVYTENAMVSGADLSLSISRAAKWQNFDWTIEGSVLDKYEPLLMEDDKVSPHTLGYSARMALGYAGFRLSGEYVSRRPDPGMQNSLDSSRMEAIQVDFGYTGHGFGGLVTFRKLRNPFLQASRDLNGLTTYINYVPALTQQHTYALANLNPYTTQQDEIGGQADLYYNFRRGTVMGGKKGMKIHANFSTYYGHERDFAGTGGYLDESRLLFRDLTVDMERWFGSDFKMILFYTWQTWHHGGGEYYRSHTVVADMTYKFDRKNSLRLELQHLYTKEDHKNWAAALLEYSFAPRWSVSVQDMWNYGDTKTHYVNGSISYSYSRVRAALNVGRFKDGYQCSGGVCRYTPAYTGFNLSLVVTL
ncbi:MAG TPA: hypothetical protein IAC03_00755 [Candidatus Coprenecus pullistercoris]|nr:hypothetical protein [Candidatus Coprenecus pullistercoris]